MQDVVERFLFDGAPVRGELVQLDATFKDVLERHPYPPVLQKLIGELMSAAALLTATIKLDGTLVMQLHGSEVVKLIVVECTSDMTLRATARWDGDVADVSLAELLGHGKFVITLDPAEGETYQGIVGFEAGETVAQIIENYMQRSEQLDTRLWLACGDERAAGLLVQKMPAGQGDENAWEHLTTLAQTVTGEELLNLPARDVLYRLYHDEDIRVFEPQTPHFACTCSRERVAGMMKMIGREEVEGIVAERGKVDVGCEFCNASYSFDAVDLAQIFSGNGLAEGSKQVH